MDTARSSHRVDHNVVCPDYHFPRAVYATRSVEQWMLGQAVDLCFNLIFNR
jgi:hypothetical protein